MINILGLGLYSAHHVKLETLCTKQLVFTVTYIHQSTTGHHCTTSGCAAPARACSQRPTQGSGWGLCLSRQRLAPALWSLCFVSSWYASWVYFFPSLCCWYASWFPSVCLCACLFPSLYASCCCLYASGLLLSSGMLSFPVSTLLVWHSSCMCALGVLFLSHAYTHISVHPSMHLYHRKIEFQDNYQSLCLPQVEKPSWSLEALCLHEGWGGIEPHKQQQHYNASGSWRWGAWLIHVNYHERSCLTGTPP